MDVMQQPTGIIPRILCDCKAGSASALMGATMGKSLWSHFCQSFGDGTQAHA